MSPNHTKPTSQHCDLLGVSIARSGARRGEPQFYLLLVVVLLLLVLLLLLLLYYMINVFKHSCIRFDSIEVVSTDYRLYSYSNVVSKIVVIQHSCGKSPSLMGKSSMLKLPVWLFPIGSSQFGASFVSPGGVIPCINGL